MTKEKKNNINFKLLLLLGIGFSVMYVFVIPPDRISEFPLQRIQNEHSQNYNSIEEFLHVLSSELNATLPRTVDQDTRLETTIAGPGNRFTYFYKLINIDSDVISQNYFETYMAPELKQRGLSTGYLNSFFEDGTTVEFRYSDRAGNHIGTVIITPLDAGF